MQQKESNKKIVTGRFAFIICEMCYILYWVTHVFVSLELALSFYHSLPSFLPLALRTVFGKTVTCGD